MKLYVYLTSLLLFLGGCGNKNLNLLSSKDEVSSQSISEIVKQNDEDLKQSSKESEILLSNSKTVDSEIKTIDDSADSLLQKNPDVIKISETIHNSVDVIRDNFAEIQNSAQNLSTKILDLQKRNLELSKQTYKIQTLEQSLLKLKNDQQKIKDDAIKNLYSTLGVAFVVGFLMIVAGVVLFFWVDKKFGISIATLGIVGCALAAGAVFYLQTIAIVALYIILGCVFLAVGYGIYHLTRKSNQVKILDKANVENVKLVQQIKDYLDPADKQEIFGDEQNQGLVEKIQSPETKKIVSEIKKTI